MKTSVFITALACLVTMNYSFAAQVTVPLEDVAKTLQSAQRGDTINILSGIYSDIEMKWKAPGHPVVVKADVTGQVEITGKSSLKFCGDSLTISGLSFLNAHPEKGNVIEFRYGKETANVSRLTDCVIQDCNPDKRNVSSSYIVLHGKNNRVDHCNLIGKLNLGVTLLINLNDARNLENHHRIDHNYFGPRPVYGSNGAETMRIGTSQQAYETSATIVEENFFDSCSGEVEIISIKSSGNIIRNNVFSKCQGVVALRHGKNNLVSGNIFDGRSVINTGGVRIVDSGHIVSDNKFCNLAGNRFFSALAVMNSVPNSLPNRYVQVNDVVITNNTFLNCSNIEFGTGKDMERTQAPIDCVFSNNIIMGDQKNPFIFIDENAGIELKDNVIEPVNREEEEQINKKANDLRLYCGASTKKVTDEGNNIDTINLPEGVIFRSQPYIVTRPTIIKGNSTVLKWNGSTGGNFITIENGGSLKIEGVTFEGVLQQGCAVVKNAISTASSMINPYFLEVENCSFINMPESGCCAIRGLKDTFADRVVISGCNFADLSGNAISFADETDDKGKYSAQEIVIKDCKFSHMLGIPVNIYRGGSDESTSGPYVNISNSLFDDVCNRERGSVLRLIGPQHLTVKNCTFKDSGRGGASIRLDETSWEDVKVESCSFENSGRVISNYNVLR